MATNRCAGAKANSATKRNLCIWGNAATRSAAPAPATVRHGRQEHRNTISVRYGATISPTFYNNDTCLATFMSMAGLRRREREEISWGWCGTGTPSRGGSAASTVVTGKSNRHFSDAERATPTETAADRRASPGSIPLQRHSAGTKPLCSKLQNQGAHESGRGMGVSRRPLAHGYRL